MVVFDNNNKKNEKKINKKVKINNNNNIKNWKKAQYHEIWWKIRLNFYVSLSLSLSFFLFFLSFYTRKKNQNKIASNIIILSSTDDQIFVSCQTKIVKSLWKYNNIIRFCSLQEWKKFDYFCSVSSHKSILNLYLVLSIF